MSVNSLRVPCIIIVRIIYFQIIWYHWTNLGSFENRFILKPAPEGVVSVAHFLTVHEQTISNRVCYFLFFGLFLAFRRFNYSELIFHYENTPMQYTVIFHGRKNDNFQMKNCNIFLIFARNIDCGYTLEPPH